MHADFRIDPGPRYPAQRSGPPSVALDEPHNSILRGLPAMLAASGAPFMSQGEETLPESSTRWRSLYDSNIVGIALSKSCGEIVEANEAFARVLGCPRGELVGRALPWMDSRSRAPAEATPDESPIAPFESRLVHVNGARVPLLLSECALPDSDCRIVIAIHAHEARRGADSSAEIAARYQTLVETTATGYVIADGQGKVLDANQEYVRLTGRRSFAEVRGRSALEWTAPYDLERNIRELSKCSTIGVVRSLEIDYIQPDGTIVPVEINATAISVDGSPTWLALCRDISERRLAQRALHESEEILRYISDNIRDVFYLANADATKTLYVNRAFEAIWGRARDEISHAPALLRQCIHPDDRTSAAELLRASLVHRQPTTFHYRVVKPNGSVRWIRDRAYPILDENGAIHRIAGIAEDVTERKSFEEIQQRTITELERRFAERTEEIRRTNVRLQEESAEHERLVLALRRSEEQYRLLADHATDMISTHTLSGIYTYVSPACRPLLGWEPDELVGRDPYDFFHPEDLATIENSHINVLETTDMQVVSYRFRRKSGDYTWLETTTRTVRDGTHPREIIAISRDISERKRLESLEHRRQWEIAHLSRLKTLGEMASGIAHELNQPLAAIANYAAACQSTVRAGESPTAMLEKIEHQAVRAGEIIRRMRNMVRKRGPHWSTVNVKEMVTECVALLGHELRLSGVHAAVRADEHIPLILGDGVQIEQVLINLLRNAIESTASNTARPPAEKRIAIELERQSAETVQVSIADTGTGISAEAAERIFEPFFSTKAEGLGLGLSISRSIIEGHGGRLWANSNATGGATFSFTLPIRKQGAP
jgi:PAS domain S-box-containing protein